MWPLSSNTSLEKSAVLQGMTDWHSHILPGVDDGVPSLEQSLEILDMYERIGIAEVWLTPHIMEDIPNTTEALRERFGQLKDAYSGSVKLNLAAENMLDNLFDERLERGDLLTIGPDGRHVLVETSYFNPPMGLYNTLQNIKSAGYFPVLAHPERYMYMEDKDYDKLRDMDVVLQLNLFSLIGGYGAMAKKKAVKLLKGGYYTLYGSDLHRLGALQTFYPMKKLDKGLLRHLPTNSL